MNQRYVKYFKENNFLNRTVLYNDRVKGDTIGKIVATKEDQDTTFYKIDNGEWIESNEIIKCMD
jgi:hypothetical protein